MATATKAKKEEAAVQPSLFSGAAIRFAAGTNDPVQKNGLFYVPHYKLKILEGFNDREDYGTAEEMDELAESIFQTGVQVPLKGYKEGENYVVIVGHRRFRAGEMIKEKHGKTVVYPLQVYPIGTKLQDMLLDTLLTNSGKDLTPLEKASTVSKLVSEKVPYKEIARAMGGVSEVYVKNLHKLSQAPEKVKNLIRKNVVSATYVIGILKDKKIDLEQWFNEVEEQAKRAKKEGGKMASVTKGKKEKRERAETRAASSVGEFKRFRKTGFDTFANKDKQETFAFMCRMFDNQLSYDDILTFFQGS